MDQGLLAPAAISRDPSEAGRIGLRVSGMSCAACVRRVERAIAAVPGAGEVAVNLARERATSPPGPISACLS